MTEALATVALALAEPLTSPASRLFWPALLVATALAGAWHLRRRGWRGVGRAMLPFHLLTHRSSRLDVQLIAVRQLLRLMGLLPAIGSAWWGATWVVRRLDAALGAPPPIEAPGWLLVAGYTLTLFVAWDLSRYVLHRLMHEVPALWQLHQVHHSAEVLTPLTFFRVHPLESVLYEARGALVTAGVAGVWFYLFRGAVEPATLLGVHALGFVMNAATGNLRHSHVWLGFGSFERLLVSPAQHQLHHGLDAAEYGVNYGTWLAVWDRLGGSWRASGERPPRAFGIPEVERNHALDDVSSALVGPVWAILRPARRRAATAASLLAALLLPAAAHAEAPPEDDESLLVIVKRRDGVPRVAGSAHVVDEEALETWSHDDVHAVLAVVPGVYTRDEDGFGLRPNIGMRGANSDRSAKTTLMEDGVLFAPAPYAAPAAYYFPMAARLVGVEVFKGPAATRFGPHTVGGAINLQTRATPDGPVAAVDVAGGSFGTGRAHAYAGSGTERWGVLIEGAHLGSAGFKTLDTGGPTGFQRQEVMGKAAWRSDPSASTTHELELKLGYGRERSHETYLGLTLPDFQDTPYRRYAASSEDLMAWDRTQAGLTWHARTENVQVRTTIYHHRLRRDWDRLNRFAGGPSLHDLLTADAAGQAGVYQDILRGEEDSVGADQLLMVAGNDRRFRAMGVQSVARWQSPLGWARSDLEIGLRVHADRVDRLHTETPYAMTEGRMVRADAPTLTQVDSRAEALAFAAHAHEELDLGRVWVLPGFRAEVIRTTLTDAGGAPDVAWRAVALPGLGLLVQASPWLDVFAGAHRGFSPVAPGSPRETRPETSWNVEAGGRASFGGVHAELVGFWNDYTNLTGQCTFSAGCTDDLDQQFNAGAVDVYGLEAVLAQRVPLPHRLELAAEGSYTWTGSAFRSGFTSTFPQFGRVEAGDALPYVPAHQGAGRASLTHPLFGLSAGANVRGAMRDVAGQDANPKGPQIPTAWTLDLAAHVALIEGVEVYATVTNLTDNPNLVSYRPFGARPNHPRQAMLGLRGALP